MQRGLLALVSVAILGIAGGCPSPVPGLDFNLSWLKDDSGSVFLVFDASASGPFGEPLTVYAIGDGTDKVVAVTAAGEEAILIPAENLGGASIIRACLDKDDLCAEHQLPGDRPAGLPGSHPPGNHSEDGDANASGGVIIEGDNNIVNLGDNNQAGETPPTSQPSGPVDQCPGRLTTLPSGTEVAQLWTHYGTLVLEARVIAQYLGDLLPECQNERKMVITYGAGYQMVVERSFITPTGIPGIIPGDPILAEFFAEDATAGIIKLGEIATVATSPEYPSPR